MQTFDKNGNPTKTELEKWEYLKETWIVSKKFIFYIYRIYPSG